METAPSLASRSQEESRSAAWVLGAPMPPMAPTPTSEPDMSTVTFYANTEFGGDDRRSTPPPSTSNGGAVHAEAIPPVGSGGGDRRSDGQAPLTKELFRRTMSAFMIIAGIFGILIIGLFSFVILLLVQNDETELDLFTPSPTPRSPPVRVTQSPTKVLTQTPSKVNGTTPNTASEVAPTAIDEESSVTLKRIRERGYLICASRTQNGYNTINSETKKREGFEIDLARAISAAIFGSPDEVSFRDVRLKDRFTTLNSQEVDLMIAAVTTTMERDLYESTARTGFTFSIPYLYNGLGIAGVPKFVNWFVHCVDNSEFTGTCSDLRICILDASTHFDIVEQLLPSADVKFFRASSVENLHREFKNGNCNTIAGEQFEISETGIRAAGYTGEYLVGKNLFSKEPLAIATRDGDALFSDLVNWVLQALITAEDQGITQATASSFTKSNFFGPAFSVNMFIDAIAAAGNLGEIYERHLGPIDPRRPINKINKGSSGLIFSYPFGKEHVVGPPPFAGLTIQKIKDRGELRCGVTRGGFAEYDSGAQTWSGFGVDFCRALSAALFHGDPNKVTYFNIPATERFEKLANGEVDVLSSITRTITSDVFEPKTMEGFQFSQPILYDGISFGGIPPYGKCADEHDITSTDCKDLKICVSDGTTAITRVRELFPEENLVVKSTNDFALQGVKNGDCQAVAGESVHDVSARSARNIGGYSGVYEIGMRGSMQDAIALATRQDDPQWTSFVNWIVLATFYAEEEGVSQSMSDKMPLTNLFGVGYTRMFRDAIQAVGSYGEIYDRNFGGDVPRQGRNLLNDNPLQAQHFPPQFLQTGHSVSHHN